MTIKKIQHERLQLRNKIEYNEIKSKLQAQPIAEDLLKF